MPMTRKFLEWHQPALLAVVEYLIDEYAIQDVLNLDDVVIVVPGRRAGRRLLEILVERTARISDFVPPRIETVGTLPELLYKSKQPFASDLVQKLAWARALKNVDRDLIAQVVPQISSENDPVRWMDLGELLWRLHRELAADGLSFDDVAKHGSAIDGFDETARWQVLRSVQQTYLKTLDELELWDPQTARLFAIEHRECCVDRDIVLVGTVDMNRAMRQMLDQVADRVTALIHAPKQLANRFDEHGCLVLDEWQNATLAIKTDQVSIVEGPLEQADAVVRTIAAYDGCYRSDEITIGVCDDRLVPHIEQQLSQSDLPSRWAAGKPIGQTAPYRLLEAIANYVDQAELCNNGSAGRFNDLAALVRHPDVFAWLNQKTFIDGASNVGQNAIDNDSNWLIQLDNYYSEHLPPRLGEWLGPAQKREPIQHIEARLRILVHPLVSEPRTLSEWTPLLVNVLRDVYANVELDRDDPIERTAVEVCRVVQAVLSEYTTIPAVISPTVTAPQAIRFTLQQLAEKSVSSNHDENAIELLGWLEVPLDDAPAMIVTTLNEGHVPKSLNSDLFLPNRLRRQLKIDDNIRRYARDAYALNTLLAVRDDLTLILARRDTQGDPLTPSRLLFAAEPDEIAHRVLAFFDPKRSNETHIPLDRTLKTNRQTSDFNVPRPQRFPEPIEVINATAFRSYLACPYRFYLRHVLNLDSRDDAVKELDALSFGNLTHEVLNQFGRSEIRHSTDARHILNFLRDALDECAIKKFGRSRLAPVDVQIMQVRLRLDAFAQWQAQWALQGWNIEYVELTCPADSVHEPQKVSIENSYSTLNPNGSRFRFEIPDSPNFPVQLRTANGHISLRGRIDRIDRNLDTGEWIVFDYKTGDGAKTPEQAHRKFGQVWIDLQLPLYRHLVKPLGIADTVKLGFIVLPKDTGKVRELLADWSDVDLAEADRVALDAADGILDQQFWPPADPSPTILTDFAAICQDGVFDKVRIDGQEVAV